MQRRISIGERTVQSPSLGPITRLIVKTSPKLVRKMATAMLQRARKEGRALRAKRQLKFDGPEKALTDREACFSPLTVESEDPSAPPVAPPAEGSEAIVRTSTPNDSGLVSEGDGLPSYEALLAERFSPISSPPLVASILADVNEDPVMAARTDVKLTELKAAPAEIPVATSASEAGPSGITIPPVFQVPPPNMYINVANAPVATALVPRATIDTPCSRICMLVPAQYSGLLQREYGADPVTSLSATGYQIVSTRNFINWSGGIPAPSSSFTGPTHFDPMGRINGFGHMY